MAKHNTNPILPAAGVCRSKVDGGGVGQLRQNDDIIPNPRGRMVSDQHAEPNTRLMRSKKTILVSTFNVRTIREECRQEELVSCMIKQGIDIIGIQEHRIVHNDPLRFIKVLGQSLITSSAWRNEAQAATGGVGLLVSQKAMKSLIGVQTVTNRILIAHFQGNPVTTAIVVYAPTNSSTLEGSEQFYLQLRTAVSSVPAHNFLMILGDLNARLGSDEFQHSFHDLTNRNGVLLIEFMQEKQLIASNTMFRKSEGKYWTYLSPNHNKYQIDFILARKKWRNSVMNTEAYSTFSSVGSDHRIVTAKFRLSLRAPRRHQRMQIKYDWYALANNTALQEQYTVEVKNRFQLLPDECPTERYARFIEANRGAAESCVPVKWKKKKVQFYDHPKVEEARQEVEDAYKTHVDATTEGSGEAIQRAKEKLFNTYKKLKEDDIFSKILQVEAASKEQQYSEAWAIINEVSGRRAINAGQVEGASPAGRVHTWYNHFSQLLGNPPQVLDEEHEISSVFESLPIDDASFTMNEYRRASFL
ncbi:uncharacterized protein LOC117298668 [Asterias rubens]|uniref:uncharacterized protein LOC117298668 n=1 Tax=Asterias rubens TaxID=7604 RepID=UPI001455526E|nr:uncharacterized protein LOC117298668 [Asterias rubens]